MTSPLSIAIQENDIERVQNLIQDGADVNRADNRGLTPLHQSILEGHIEIALALIHQGADVNRANNVGTTPLHFAAYFGHTETALALIQQGADVNRPNDKGSPPLYYAMVSDNKTTVLAIIHYGRVPLVDIPEIKGNPVSDYIRQQQVSALARGLFTARDPAPTLKNIIMARIKIYRKMLKEENSYLKIKTIVRTLPQTDSLLAAIPSDNLKHVLEYSGLLPPTVSSEDLQTPSEPLAAAEEKAAEGPTAR